MHQAPETMLNRLLAVSLVEKQFAHTWQTHQYQCSPLVAEWLQKQNTPAPNRQLFRTAAKYQRYLFDNERGNLDQAIIVHQALRVAGENNEADRLAIEVIIGQLSLHGFYQTLLTEWLPDICQSENRQIQAQALGQTGKQHLHLGDYDTALDYLKQSLAIHQGVGDKSGEGATLNNISEIYRARGDYDTALEYAKQSLSNKQEIGDKSGEGATLNNISQIYQACGDCDTALDCLKQSLAITQEIGNRSLFCATLFNIGLIHHQNEEIPQALQAWVAVYRQAQSMNLAQALDALENLANQLKLPGGLDGWEKLAKQIEDAEQ